MTFSPELAAQYGIAAAVLSWLMFRVESKLDAISQTNREVTVAVQQLARAVTLDVATRPHLSPAVREKVNELLDELPPGRRKPDRRTA